MPVPWVQAGVVAEKDPGESTSHGFASGFLRVGRKREGIELTVGDYRLETGSGILLGRPSFSAPGATLFTGSRAAAGPVRPHTSADENRFFRGAAVRLPLNVGSWSIRATVFASLVRRSGRVDSNSTFIPYTAGLFRTPSELNRWNTNRERLGGAVVSLQWSGFRMAFNGLWTGFDHPVQIQQGKEPPIRSWIGGSVEAGVTGAGFQVSGEAACSGGLGLTLEARAMPSRHLTAVFQIQSVRPGFCAPLGVEMFGRSMTDLSSACNVTCQIRPTGWARGVMAASVVSSGEPGTYEPLPSARVRLSSEAELFLTPGWSVLMFAGNIRADDGVALADPGGRSVRVMREEERSTLRLQSTVNGAGQWSIRNRCEVVSALRASDGSREHGVLLQTDFKVRVSAGVRAAFRGCLFDVDGWGARLYSAEEDVEGAMRIPLFVGRGLRMYALLRWEVAPAVAVSCRYGVTFQETIPRGKSLESMVAREEHDLSIQLDAAY